MYSRRLTHAPARLTHLLVAIAAALLIAIAAGSTLLAQSGQDLSAGDPEELADAIEQANAEPNLAATITLQMQTYALSSELPSIQSEITIVGSGATIERIDDPEVAEFRVLDVEEPGDLTLNDVTISGGLVAGEGGGIRNHGNLTIVDSAILNNTVFNAGEVPLTRGGGIFNADGAELTVLDSTIEGNEAIDGFGGGVSAQGNVVIAESTLTGNVADQNGGAIAGNQQNAALHIESSEIYDNHAHQGGGVHAPTESETVISESAIYANSAENRGGGVHISTGGQLTVVDSEIRDNTAGEDGGGIFGAGLILVAASTIDLEGVSILDNTSGGHGGGVRAEGWLWVNESHVEGNIAEDGGGGLSIHPNPGGLDATIESSDIIGNESGTLGGGIYFLDGAFSMTRSTVEGNSAGTAGGGMGFGANAEAEITESTINGNQAGSSSGGISVFGSSSDDATLTLINSTVSNNESDGHGGGVRVGMHASATLLNNTITGNSAGEFGGGGVSVSPADPTGPGSLEISNTIVAGNSATEDEANDLRVPAASQLTDGGHNLVGNGAGAEGAIADGDNGNIVGTADDQVDPVIGPLQDNGGPTETMALLDGSPAIEAGNDANAPATDQRGVERPQGAQSDIGAYEREFVEPEPEPAEFIDDLNETVESMDVHRSNQLTNQLDSALRHLDNGRERRACHHLNVFIRHADRQIGQRNGLTDEEAAALIEEAEAIKAELGC